MTDRRAAEIMYPDQGKDWRIELKSHPIFHRGHAFLALIDGDDRIVGELHGLSYSKHTDEQMMVGMDGADLRGVPTGPGEPSPIGGEKILLGELRRGSKEEIERIWANGVAAANAITENRFDYKAHDPSYEAGTDGGQIQNSNSVAYTISKAMGLAADANRVLREKNENRRFSGWDRDLLDPKYKRYAVAPPVFPVRDAPLRIFEYNP